MCQGPSAFKEDIPFAQNALSTSLCLKPIHHQSSSMPPSSHISKQTLPLPHTYLQPEELFRLLLNSVHTCATQHNSQELITTCSYVHLN